MTRRGGLISALVAVIAFSGVASANAPTTSPRPVTREHVFPPALPSFAPEQSLRPKVRPSRVSRAVSAQTQPVVAAAAPTPPAKKPSKTSSGATQVASVSGRDAAEQGITNKGKARKRLPDGMSYLCKSKTIIGQTHPPVPGKLAGCGIKKGAIKVYQVGDVKLSRPAVMTCDTAQALHTWAEDGVVDAVKKYGGGISSLKVAAGYSCRTRNHRKGAKISEHGKGKAIDISGVYVKSGEEISVLRDWGKGKKGRMLKKMHKSACGPFGTVLGPNSDRHHRDHFHFDVARHRGGPYCR